MNKKYCVINNDLTYFNLHRKKFINIIDKKNNKITLFFPQLFNSPKYEKNIIKLLDEGFQIKFFFLKRKNINILFELWTFFTLFIRLFEGYNYVYTSTIKLNLHLIFLNLFFKSTLILHFSGLGYFYVNNKFLIRLIRNIIENLFKYFVKKNTLCIFENTEDLEYFTNKKKVFNYNNCLAINGVGVNIQKFHPIIKNKSIFNVLMVSRITYEKGVDDYLSCYESFKLNQNYKFILIGPYEKNKKNNKLFQKIKLYNKNNNFEYHEWINNIKTYYDIAHASILPSYREGLSVFLLESLASGLPIISTNVTGNKALVKEDFNGYLVNINSPKEIKDSIMKLKKNKAIYDKFSTNSRILANQIFDENIIIKKFKKFLTDKNIL